LSKIINRGKEDNVPAEDIAARFIKEFETDFNALKLRKHTANPKVTESWSRS